MLSYMYVMCTFFRFTFAFTVTTLFLAFLLALMNEFCRCCGFSLRQRTRYFAVQRLLPIAATCRLCKRVFRAVSVPMYALLSSFDASDDPATPSAQLHHASHAASTDSADRAVRSRSLSPSRASLPRSAFHQPVPTHTSCTPHTSLDSSSSSSSFHSVLLHHATAAAQGSRLSRPPRPPRHRDNNDDSALNDTGARRKPASRYRSDYHDDSSPRPARSAPKAL
ncbi:Ja178 [Japanese cytomegalovirus]|nr:Ja178 [Japanese cytomegalovirus]